MLVLHPDVRMRARIRSAARSWRVHELATWEEVPALLQKGPLLTLAVVDPYTTDGKALEPALAGLCRAYPSLPVIAALELEPRRIQDALTLGQWGVTEILDLHGGEATALRTRLEQAASRPMQRVLAGVGLKGSTRAQAILHTAVEVAMKGGGVRDLARSLITSQRTLRRVIDAAGLPPARELLVWIRVLWAAALLADPSRRVLEVGFLVGYSGDDALRRALRETVGLSPTELRERGAWDTVLKAFHERLQA